MRGIGWYDKNGDLIPGTDAEIGSEEWRAAYRLVVDRRLNDPEYKRVAETYVGETWVSTVWLGLDHSFTEDGPPVIFETLVFDGPLDGETDRYCTEAEAAAGHEAMVARVRKAQLRSFWRRLFRRQR